MQTNQAGSILPTYAIESRSVYNHRLDQTERRSPMSGFTQIVASGLNCERKTKCLASQRHPICFGRALLPRNPNSL